MGRSEVVERFTAVDNAGNEHRMIVTQEMISTNSHDGRGELPGMKTYMTSDGMVANMKDENTFEIVQRGLVVKRKV